MTATDKDSGSNAELTYSVSDDHFVIDTRRDSLTGKYVGDLRVAKYDHFLSYIKWKNKIECYFIDYFHATINVL